MTDTPEAPQVEEPAVSQPAPSKSVAWASFWLGVASLAMALLAAPGVISHRNGGAFLLMLVSSSAAFAAIVLGAVAGWLVWRRPSAFGGTRLLLLVLLGCAAAFLTFATAVHSTRRHLAGYNGVQTAPSTLRTLNTAMITYASTYNQGFPDSLRKLGPPPKGQPDMNHADLVEGVLAGLGKGATGTSFVKAGYKFTYMPGPGAFGRIATYTVTARPLEHGKTAMRSFFTDQSNVIRATTENRDANARDTPI